MTYTIAGEGDHCLDFLVPVVARSRKFRVIYRQGIARDTVSSQRIDKFVSMLTHREVATVSRDELFIDFYKLQHNSWPMPVPEMLETLYASAGLDNTTVKIRRSNENLRLATQAYLSLLELQSDGDWTHAINSGSSNVYLFDASGKKHALENISIRNGRVIAKAGGLAVSPSLDGIAQVRLSGERAIIHQFEHGSPAYIPWYVRNSCAKCHGKCKISIPRFFTPIYDRTFRRNIALTVSSAERPWGLLHDIFDFAQPRITTPLSLVLAEKIRGWMPSQLEDVILRCALRENIGERRKRSAARDTVDGIARTFASAGSALGHYSGFFNICGESRLLSQSFLPKLWLLSGLRGLRKGIHTRNYTDIEKWIINHKERVEIGYPHLSGPTRSRIERVMRLLVRSDTDSVTHKNIETAIWDFKSKPTPLGAAELELKQSLCEEILKCWDGLESSMRATPYKMFSLLPYFRLHEKNRTESDSHSNLCLICCRRM
ncbi:hypothetical protein AB0L41_47490 [Amycolatopsis mediterranei]|uniref:hypothetical protein n=1 Tax=Amycolatopsis mediterranei TaxID=33910 RepID=UPI0034157CD7